VVYVHVFVFSVPSQDIVWKKHLQNGLFCVELDVKPELSQLTMDLSPAREANKNVLSSR